MNEDNRRTIVSAEGLVKSYGEIKAVRGISLSISEGEIFGFIGPDGAGKTTTVQMLVGVLPPESGTVSVLGNDVVSDAESIKAHIGYMPQQFSLYEDLTVWENIRFFGMLYKLRLRPTDDWVDRLLSFSRLSPFLKRPAGKLSGGMKKKLALCCALIHRPPLLFLDEPTTGVDPISRVELWEILYQLVEEGLVTIFFTSPYMDEAERAGRIALLSAGRILTCDRPRAVRDSVAGVILEFKVDDLLKARDVLRKHFGEVRVNVWSIYLHLLVEKPKEDGAQARKILKKEGIKLVSLREKHISLEDAFIARIGAERGGEGE